MNREQNPFEQEGGDRKEIWDLAVKAQMEAVITGDFSALKGRIIPDYMRIDANQSTDPTRWFIHIHSAEDYFEKSKMMTKYFNADTYPNLRQESYASTVANTIEINGKWSLLHGTIDAKMVSKDGKVFRANSRFIERTKKVDGVWMLGSSINNIPYMSSSTCCQKNCCGKPAGKSLPEGLAAPATAGAGGPPYSPVLNVTGNRLVVISGQVPVGADGKVIGETIEEQTEATLQNARKQLQLAGVDFDAVFKVNAYLTDLDLWGRFNTVYEKTMPKPFPVRTVVQSGLLSSFLVEIDMWAVKT